MSASARRAQDDMPREVRIGLVQMTSRLGDPEANLAQAEDAVTTLAGQADLACFPELFAVGYDLATLGRDALLRLAEPVPSGTGEPAGATVARLSELAAGASCAIVAGVLERDPQRPDHLYDTAVLIDRGGCVRGRYRKTHLYPAEQAVFARGDDLPVFELDGLRVGVAICFEAAFAPIASTLALRGARLICNPSAVPVGYEHVHDQRPRARAQDNQLFVAAVNRVGTEGTVRYCGRSQVADPRGEVVVLAPADRPAVVTARCDLTRIAEERRREPVLPGFRPELYRFAPPTEETA